MGEVLLSSSGAPVGKPLSNPLRIGDAVGWTGGLFLPGSYCAMVFTDTPRSSGVERP